MHLGAVRLEKLEAQNYTFPMDGFVGLKHAFYQEKVCMCGHVGSYKVDVAADATSEAEVLPVTIA